MNIKKTDNELYSFLFNASRVMKSLGHPVRLEILKFLQYKERTVTEIQRHVNLVQAVTSQHLRKMYREGIVKYRRRGTTSYYSIANQFIHSLLNCYSECEEKILSGEWDPEEFGLKPGRSTVSESE